MAALCWMNAIKCSPEVVPICNRSFPGPTRVLDANGSRSYQKFLSDSLSDRPRDRPTDHATRSFTIGGIYVRSTGCGLLIETLSSYI